MARKTTPDPERVIQGMTEFNVDELAEMLGGILG